MPTNFSDLSFLVEVQEVRCDYSGTEQPRTVLQDWYPPRKSNSIRRTGTPFRLKWKAGELKNITNSSAQMYQDWVKYGRTVTAFTQSNLQRLLFVNFDASRRDLDPANDREYAVLSFEHRQAAPPNSTKRVSYADPDRGRDCIAGRHRNSWMPQLIPQHNQWRPRSSQQTSPPQHEGIIGRLAVLLALAAFAGIPNQAKAVMRDCVRPHEWHHRSNLTPGRAEERRGLVVKIFLDPENKNHSKASQLERLENGEFGVFYD